MANLNLRGVPNNLAAQLKSEAIWAGMGFHEYCVAILERREDYRISVLREEKEKRLGKIFSPIFRLESEETDRHGNLVPQKKIADISVGGGATEGGGDPGLPRGVKAQDGNELWNRALDEHFAMEGKIVEPFIYGRSGIAPDFNEVIIPRQAEIAARESVANPTITVTREEFDGIKGSGEAGQDKRTAGGDSQPVAEGDHGAQEPAVGVGKPGVNMQALRDICEGKGIRPAPLSAEPVEVDLCGFKSYNETDGEWYVCTKEKHGVKVNHGDWLKV